jgi:hypothetical protein
MLISRSKRTKVEERKIGQKGPILVKYKGSTVDKKAKEDILVTSVTL